MATYRLSQDHLEMFFGAVRSMHGWNDNPTVQQFTSSFKKLQMNSNVMLSGSSNIWTRAQSSIFNVSSGSSNTNSGFGENTAADTITDLEQINAGNYLIDITHDAGISFVAATIERQLLQCGQV